MKSPFWCRPNITLSYWLALSAALISFAIVSGQLFFAAFIALGAVALRSIATTVSSRIRHGACFAFTLAVYTTALLPLWPEKLSAYYYAPLILIIGVALIAAFNRHSYGGSRGVSSIVAIAFLLFIRNIVLYFHFEAPLPELSFSFAFVGLMEIALSNRFHKGEDNPHPELVFGLLLALVASFQFTSLLLAIVLAALPILAFLIRNHEFGRYSNEHTRSATLISGAIQKSNSRGTLLALAIIPFLAATLLYLTTLQAPFWADFLPRDAPYLAKSIAQKANTISQASNLSDEGIQEATNELVDQEFLKEKANQIARNWSRDNQDDAQLKEDEKRDPPIFSQRSDTPESKPYDQDNYDYSLGPFARNRANANQPTDLKGNNGTPGAGSQFPSLPNSQSQGSSPRNLDSVVPPTPESLNPGIPGGLDTDLSTFAGTSPNGQANGDLSNTSNTDPSLANSATQETFPEPDFDEFLESFEQPERAITQALNLEGSDVSALLSEEALVTVKLNSTRAAPRRLYLRSNVLDTVDRNGLGGIRSKEGQVELPTLDDRILTLRTFRQSKSAASTLTITSNQSRSPTLPLPESFGSIQVFESDTLKVYPNERVALAPRSQEPVSYRVFEADLEVTARERRTASISDKYRESMLEVPLSREDRSYLEKLAKRVGGSRSPSRQFAYRFANYFANRHPYSYFVTIPPGPGHSVVRWLENERPGLCSNYAAAFTLLARSRGIPTRVVGGFASNEFDAKESRYIMRQNNAHAWVEYLDESNRWIRFDPTPGISEAEIIRAAQYVSSGNTQSLQRLLAREAEIEQEQDTTLSEQAPSQASVEREAPLASTKSQETSTDTDQSITAPLEQNHNDRDQTESTATATSPKPTQQARSNVQTPTLSSNPIPQSISSQNASPAQERVSESNPDSPQSETSSQESENPPWLILLAILALIIPGIVYFMRLQKPSAASPELQLRHQAGRLLSKLDSLIREHRLTEDPIWVETRQTLSEQRYGRETSSILVEDLAVKVALLSKRKKQK